MEVVASSMALKKWRAKESVVADNAVAESSGIVLP